MASIIVRFFGPLKDVVGKDELVVDLQSACTGEVAFSELARAHPRLAEWRASVRIAINLEYAAFTDALKDGDEISFIPPVSGG